MAGGGATAAQRRKECRGFVWCVEANGSAAGAGNRRGRSPVGGGAGKPGGVDHCRRTAAGRGQTADTRERERERGAGGRRKKEEKKSTRKKKEKKKRKRKIERKEMRSNPHNLGHENDPTETFLKQLVK